VRSGAEKRGVNFRTVPSRVLIGTVEVYHALGCVGFFNTGLGCDNLSLYERSIVA
jgi:hypothetical protein